MISTSGWFTATIWEMELNVLDLTLEYLFYNDRIVDLFPLTPRLPVCSYIKYDQCVGQSVGQPVGKPANKLDW